MKNNPFRQSVSGSPALLRAHGSGGASTTINKLAPPKNFRAKPKQASKKEGEVSREGIFARLLTLPAARMGWERFRLSALVEGQNRKIFFSLIGKNFGRAQQKSRENFFAGSRAHASGGGAASFVGGLPEMRSDFVQGMEPDRMIRVHRLGASPLGGQIGENFLRLFGFKANRLRAQNVVRRAKRAVNGNLQPILFLPPLAEGKAIVFNSPKAIVQ